MEQKNKLTLTIKGAFYCLKHFKKLNQTIFSFFLRNTYSKDQIINQTSIIGSKFFNSFLVSPFDVFDKIKDRLPTKIIHQKNGNVVYIYFFDIFIGTDSLIPIKKLSKAEVSLIQIETRSCIEIKSLKKNKIKKTRQLNLIFNKKNHEIITMFPGIYAPPFSNFEMTSEEKADSDLFWNKHVFIRS